MLGVTTYDKAIVTFLTGLAGLLVVIWPQMQGWEPILISVVGAALQSLLVYYTRNRGTTYESKTRERNKLS